MWVMLLISLSLISVLLLALTAFFYWREKKRYSHSQQQVEKLQSALANQQAEMAELQIKFDQAINDPVTNLIGWQLFLDRLDFTIHESQRYSLTFGVLFIDIDNFNVINNALSYAVGDALLKQIGERLKTCIRLVDSLTRSMKDTFVIMLSKLSKPETAAIVAQRILQALAKPYKIEGHEISLTASIGIATFPADGTDVNQLLCAAGNALQLAKSAGKNQYQFYYAKMQTESQYELLLANCLQNEAIYQEFKLNYRAVVNLQTQQLFAYELAISWDHAVIGHLKIDEIFLLAIKQHCLNSICEWVLKSACQKYLQQQAEQADQALIIVPIALLQLENIQFICRISQYFREIGFNPGRLILQLHVSNTALNLVQLEKSFNMLKYMGIKISMADFGSNAFPLNYLNQFSLDYLKLDPNLIDASHAQAPTFKMVKATILLANELELQVIIPSLQDEQQAEKVKQIGAHFGLGSYVDQAFLGVN
jgi:diguanylate cyclase